MRTVVSRLLVGAWLVVSLAALAAMYHLWWSRERALYAGKSAEQQRVAVFERAGIPAQTLEMASRADAAWPLAAAYEADGSEVSLSYFKYLVLPRIPAGSEEYRIEEADGTYALTREAGKAEPHRPFLTVDATPRGLVLSALVLLAVAAGLSRFGISIPEGVACASLLLWAVSVLLKPVFHSYTPTGIFMCALGAAGALAFWKRKGPLQTRPSNEEMSREKGMKFLSSLALAMLSAAILWSLLMAVVVVPDDWDAWAQWGPKAKILAVSAARSAM